MKIKNLKVLDLFKWKGNPQGEFRTTKHKDIGNFLLSLLKNNKNEDMLNELEIIELKNKILENINSYKDWFNKICI